MARTARPSEMMSSRTPARARATLMCGSSSCTCSNSKDVSMISLLLILYLWLYGCLCDSTRDIYCRSYRFRQRRPIVVGQGGHHGQFFKILQWDRGWYSPLKSFSAPFVGSSNLTAHERVNHVVDERKHRCRDQDGKQAGDQIGSGKRGGNICRPAGFALQTRVEQRRECSHKSDFKQPEMEPAQQRVEAFPHHLGEPVIEACEKPEDPGPDEREVEVRGDKHTAVQNLIGRQISQVDARDSPNDEVDQQAAHKQHG